MKRIIPFIVSICLFSTSSFSQFKLGLTPGVAIPIGNLSDAGFGTGFGATLTGEYLIAKGTIGVGANLGYYSLGSPSGTTGYSFNIKPVTALFRYYFITEGFKPFVGVDAGLYISTATVDFLGQSISSSSSNFGVAPVAGFLYDVSKNFDLGLNVKYNTIFSGYTTSTGSSNSASFLGINVAAYYTFGGKK